MKSMTGFLWALLMPPVSTLAWALLYRAIGFPPPFRALPFRKIAAEILVPSWCVSSLLIAVMMGVLRAWPEMGGSLASAAVAACIWFWRRRRDRVRAWLGAKSKALRDALVQRMPRPVVLRPGLGSAS
jgi:hypothetical protein